MQPGICTVGDALWGFLLWKGEYHKEFCDTTDISLGEFSLVITTSVQYSPTANQLRPFMYKVKTNLVPPYISDLFSCDMSRYNLRNTDDFSLPRCNTVTYERHSLRYMGPYIWSKLHKSIKMADSLTAFKNQVRALDLSNVMSKNNCKNCKLCKT